MADIFDEVSEDLRRDKAKEAWKKYGKYVIAAAVLVVVGTAGRTGWQEYQRSIEAERSAAYGSAQSLIGAGKTEEALSGLANIVSSRDDGYAMLARFDTAGIKAKNGDIDGAIASLDAIAGDKGTDTMYRDLATVLASLYRVEKGDAAGIADKLKPITEAGNPWRYSALLVTAEADLASGDTKAARDGLAALSDDASAPSALRARAAQLLEAVGG